MEYIHIKKLEKYHPGYKDRSLVWCKTYFKMINTDPEFELLCEIDKWRFVALVMLELQLQKPVPLSEEWLKRKGFDLKKRPMSLTLKMLHNSIETVTVDKKVCNVDKEKDKEEEKEPTEKKKASFIPPSLKDIEDYIKKEGYNVNPKIFYKFFTESGWVDTKGNKVRNWKGKIITWGSYSKGEQRKGSIPPKEPTPAQIEQKRVNKEADDLYENLGRDEK